MNWSRHKHSPAWVWVAFGCCACLVLAAMLWLTRSVIKTERNRALAEIRAEQQERVRLSLWRMDSLGASILLEENSIPPQLFLSDAETTLPCIVRFETPDGAAIRGEGDPDALQKVATQLPTLISNLKISLQAEGKPLKKSSSGSELENPDSKKLIENKIRGGPAAQNFANSVEKATREKWLGEALSRQREQNLQYKTVIPSEGSVEDLPIPDSSASLADRRQPISPSTPSAKEISNPVGDFKPTWFDGSLYLIRRGLSITTFAQGSLIDGRELTEILQAEANQLLPGSKLVPAHAQDTDDSFVLASFPYKLHPGKISATPDRIPGSITISLLVGWLATLTALIIASILISNVIELSERRASFVSAVTHELRTPLTTFRLYSDILSSGAVREEKRPSYLNVLSREADRLSHLVENVLAFSRIERGSARSTIAKVDLPILLSGMRERFESRLAAAGLELKMDLPSSCDITLDASALEHILFNIIDNAAKYAAVSEPPLVTLKILDFPKKIEIHVIDHGPGIPVDECKRIFRPFHKSAKQAAESMPGVGLGLALSQRLARSMNGSISCRQPHDSDRGTVFILILPRL
ncbi:sensor histidine kinase [Luteolibacter algae]|uniref:histidine kinase n=1 Tax=Luteolibacter algae TaxID=454151 RepID=A0ABW5D7P9_9BACT